jgi:hypothetical protein
MKRLYFALTLTVIASLLLTACGSPAALARPTAPPTPRSLVAFAAQVPAGIAAPIVVQRTPERGEELPLDGTIELVFDRAMDQAAMESAFTIAPRSREASSGPTSAPSASSQPKPWTAPPGTTSSWGRAPRTPTVWP